MMKVSRKKYIHDKCAPYWASAMISSCGMGVSCIWLKGNAFWNGYILDIMGPAWNYILFRGLGTSYSFNLWTHFFTPKKVFILFACICISIEMAQFFKLYESTFDLWDFLAYFSLLTPLFLLDRFQQSKMSTSS